MIAKINIDKLLVKLWIVSAFLDAYSLFYINEYHVTVFTIVTVIAIVNGLVKIIKSKGTIVSSPALTAAVFMVLHIVISTLIVGYGNYTSPLRSCFTFAALILSARVEDKEYFSEYIRLFQKLMNIMAVYGIYQFFGRMYSFPFSDLIIEDHMVPGFNWSNIETFWGNNVYRSNAIFLEPSFFSQFLAVNILIYVSGLISENKKTKKDIIALIINFVAMIFTFGGTGVIILFIGALLFIISQLSERRKAKKIITAIVVAVVIFLLLLPIISQTEIWNSAIQFITKRIAEITGQNKGALSGWIRFVSGFVITAGIWSQGIINLLFGGGMGSAEYYTNIYAPGGALDNNAIYRVSGELGIIGIAIYIFFLIEIFRSSRGDTHKFIIASSLIAMTVCGEAFMLNYAWILIYILNCRETVKNNVKSEGSYEKEV